MPQTVASLRMEMGERTQTTRTGEGVILLLSYHFRNHHLRISMCITTYSGSTIAKVTFDINFSRLLHHFNPDDWLLAETYDSNGNMLITGGRVSPTTQKTG